MRNFIPYDEQPAQTPNGRSEKIRKDRIEALTISIQSETYRLSSELVADCMIRETLERFADFRLYSSDENLQSHQTSVREKVQSTHIQPLESSRNYRPTG